MAAPTVVGRTLLAIFFIYTGYRRLLLPEEASSGVRGFSALTGPLAVLYVAGGYLLVGCTASAIWAAALALALLTSTALEVASGEPVDEAQVMTAVALVGALISVSHSAHQEEQQLYGVPAETKEKNFVGAVVRNTPHKAQPPLYVEGCSDTESTADPSPCVSSYDSSPSSPAAALVRSTSSECSSPSYSSALRLREMQIAALHRLLHSAEAELQQQRLVPFRRDDQEMALLRLQNQGLRRLLAAQSSEPPITAPSAALPLEADASAGEVLCEVVAGTTGAADAIAEADSCVPRSLGCPPEPPATPQETEDEGR
eukprot:GGOE01061390.1.p1 GENE.GGOE01061390.1~~GGOE01061390.1.p1  ORF type:complete len:332 (+),score=83.21 GGOE01061390.1:56-997(+)